MKFTSALFFLLNCYSFDSFITPIGSLQHRSRFSFTRNSICNKPEFYIPPLSKSDEIKKNPIIRESDHLINSAPTNNSPMTDASLIIKAAAFAAIQHQYQKRKGEHETPYILHPLGVAKILDEVGVTDVNVVVAAIFHDLLEDTDTTFEIIKTDFGEIVASIVLEVTDLQSADYQERKQAQIDKAPLLSKEAKLVKMADKIYNLRDIMRSPISGWDRTRIQNYFIWAKRVTDGCRGVNAQLDSILDEIYEKGKFEFEGNSYPVIPKK